MKKHGPKAEETAAIILQAIRAGSSKARILQLLGLLQKQIMDNE